MSFTGTRGETSAVTVDCVSDVTLTIETDKGEANCATSLTREPEAAVATLVAL
jgi:hypothetical protein